MSEKKRVLVIDDEPEIRDHIIRLFNIHYPDQLNIREAENGQAALRLTESNKFDCIITDLHMPKLNGEEFIKELRSNKLNHSCPVVIVSGNPKESLLKQFSYLIMLSKPFNKKDFIEIFTNQLKLGSNNNRISGAVLNAFITEMSQFIKSKTKTDMKPSSLISKSSQDKIYNDCCIKAEVHINNTINTYIIGLDKTFAADIKQNLALKKVRESDIALTLLSNTRDLLQKNHGFSSVAFKNIRFFCDDEAKRCLKEAVGIMVKLSYDMDHMNIIAISGMMANPDTNNKLHREDCSFTKNIKTVA